MIYPYNIDKLLSGEATQWRRLVKPNDMFTYPLSMVVIGKDHGKIIDTLPLLPKFTAGHEIYCVVDKIQYGRARFQVGKNYAVQPGRGKPAVARIRITNIRKQDVRDISEEDVKAEGFESRLDFLAKWSQMHDRVFQFDRDDENWSEDGTWNYWANRQWGKADNAVMYSYIAERPTDRYIAWALTFTLEVTP